MSNKMPQNLYFRIKISQFGPNSFFVEIESPTGEAEGTFALPFEPTMLQATLDNFRQNIKETRNASKSRQEIYSGQVLTPEEVGTQLFEAVFQKEIKIHYQQSRKQSRQERRPLLFKLDIHPRVDHLINLPWEYLFDPEQGVRGEFFAFNAETPIIRRWRGQEPRPFDPISPMRVLIVSSRPKGSEAGLANLQREAKAVKTQLDAMNHKARKKIVRVEHLEAANLTELGDIVRDPDRTPHIIHFIGHGSVGTLLFEEEYTGQQLFASEDTLTIMLRNASNLRLVVLNACRTARADKLENQLGVAQSLADTGIPAVLAMQFNISDDAAEIFAAEFYKVIAEGRSIDQAVTWGRIKIQQKFQNDEAREWGTPALYLQTEDGHIFSDLIQRQVIVGQEGNVDAQKEEYAGPPNPFAQPEIATVTTGSSQITDTEQARQQADEAAQLIAHYRKEIEIHTANLRTLKLQEAQFGIDVPLSILNSIKREEEAIKKLYDLLKSLTPDVEPELPDGQVMSSGRSRPVKPVSVNIDTDAIKRITPSIRDQVTQMYDKGNSALQAGEWGEAVKLLSRAQKLSSDLPNIEDLVAQGRDRWRQTKEGQTRYYTLDAQYDRAMAYITQEDWDTAALLLEDIVTTDASYKDAYERSLETREKAETQKAEQEKQERLANLYQQAQTAITAGGWAAAVDDLTQIVEIEPGYAAGQAVELLKKATRQRDMQEAYTQGKAFYEKKDWANAVAALGKLFSMDDEGQYSDVKDLLEQSRHQRQLDAWIKEAEAYTDQKNWQEAIKILEGQDIARERVEGRLALHYARALQARERSAWDQVAENLKEVMQTRSNYRPDLEILYQEAGQQVRLARLFQEAIAYISANDWVSAKARLEQILKAEKDYPNAQEKLWQVDEEIRLMNRYEQAEKLMSLKHWGEAIPLWKEILQDRPQGYREAAKQLAEAEEQLELNTFYRQGVEAAGRGDWPKAYDAFAYVAGKAANFRDVQGQLKNARDKIDLSNAFAKGVEALEKGRTHFNLEQLEFAVTSLQKACELDPRYRGAENRLNEARREYKLLTHYLKGQEAFANRAWAAAVKSWKELVENEGQPEYHGDAAQKLAEAERLAHLADLYQKAQTAQKDKDWTEAIILLRQVAGDPDFPDAAHELAAAEAEQELLLAFNQAKQAVKVENWTEAIARLEFIENKQASYHQEEVTNLLNQAKNSLTLETTYAEGMAAIQIQDWETARLRFQMIYNTDSDYRDVETRLLQARQQQTLSEYYENGKTAYQDGVWETAIRWFTQIQDIDPDYQDAKERLAGAQLQKQLAQAYEEALKKLEAKDWPNALTLLKDILARQNPYEEAAAKLAEAEKQIKLAQNYDQAQDALKKNLWVQAVILLSEINMIDPDYKDAADLLASTQKQKSLDELYKRATVLREVEENWPEALRLLEQVINLDHNYKDAITLKYDLQEKLRQSEIDQLYHQAEGILDTDEEARWDDGISRLEQLLDKEPGYEKAQRLLDKARNRRTERIQELRRQAGQAKEQRRWSQALPPLRRLIDLEPDNAALQAELGQIERSQQAYQRQKRSRVMIGIIAGIVILVCTSIPLLAGGFNRWFTPAAPTPDEFIRVGMTNPTKPAATPNPLSTPTVSATVENETVIVLSPTSTPTLSPATPEEPAPTEELSPTPVSPQITPATPAAEEPTPTPILPPDSVTDLQATDLSQTSVTLSWSASGDHSGLIIQLGETVIAELPAGSESFMVEALTCGTSYDFAVIISKDAQLSSPAQIAVTTAECAPDLPPPTGKIAVAVFNQQTSSYDIYVAGAANRWQPVLVFEGGSQPDFSPTGQKIIARSWGRNPYKLAQKLIIFTIDPTTLALINTPGSIRQMTHNVEDAHPSWRPGQHEGDLLFHSSRNPGEANLFLLGTGPGADASPSNQVNLGIGENPDWLGTEKMVFFSKQDGSGIWVVNSGDGNRQLVYPHPAPVAPAGAPDGDAIAVALPAGGDWWNIHRLSASAGQASVKQLTSGNFHDWLPTWSPDGNYIAFVSDRDAVGGQWAVWVIPANEENPEPVRLFALSGSPQGIVLHAKDLSRGWGEERISWGP